MTLPCKVFVGLSSHVNTDVEWLANDTTVDVVYKQSRVTEGERQEIVENGENFIEVPLIFDSVEEVDFYTDFTCLAHNRYGYQVLPTRVKQEAVGLSWYIAVIPVALACVIVAGICMHKRWKWRANKGYTTARVKTCFILQPPTEQKTILAIFHTRHRETLQTRHPAFPADG